MNEILGCPESGRMVLVKSFNYRWLIETRDRESWFGAEFKKPAGFWLVLLRLALAAIACLTAACSSNEPSSIAYHLPETYQPTESIRYRVEGGGNVDFTIGALQDSLIIDVTKFQFEDRHDSFALARSDLDPFVVGLADSVFAGTVNVGGTIYVNEIPTGTWSYVYVRQNEEWLRIGNGSLIQGLSPLVDIVRTRLEASVSQVPAIQVIRG